MSDTEQKFHYLSLINLSGTGNNSQSTIEVLRVGKLQDRGLMITRPMLEEYVKNFESNVYGTEIQVNLGHNREGEAAGWIKRLFINGESLMAEVEWTVLGQEKITNKLYKFISAELASKFKHFKTGDIFNNVFIGAALTNTPALKGQEPIGLSEELNTLFLNNDKAMFKKFLAELQARTFLSEEDKKLAHTMLAELPADEQDEHKEEMAKIDQMPTEPPKTEGGEGDGAGEGTKEEALAEKKVIPEEEQKPVPPVEEEDMKDKKMADKKMECKEQKCMDKKCMTHYEKNGEKKMKKLNEELSIESLSERISLLEEENNQLRKEKELALLNEEVGEKLILSEKTPVGFSDEQKATVVNFLAELTQQQRETFYSLLSEVRSVELGIKGFSAPSSSKVNLSGDYEDQVVSLSDQLFKEGKAKTIEEAQKMAMQQLQK